MGNSTYEAPTRPSVTLTSEASRDELRHLTISRGYGHLETLAIQNGKGQRFVWRFDTLHAPTGFPLKSIAPPDFDAGDTWVYVGPKAGLK